ncbi:acetyl/propionyl/methylcrotonyl-CoA carboxylase subunit alpha [Ehrlichia canis]|uniref:Biotin/lipoyl attachment:Carbamoyl-phosphate synthase L chain, ATP-binding:Carbamoyl-phosphate synthetase large chain, N-terminal:Biotincarboxylase,C-terminal n=1 Tax=Ehrlichia canis (strain Jake) TaxID=269484 RepID=A0ACA6AW32_EHRCJ|nr:acetyl-CoA carboxylase biotin carboxylase subunit [Ehrlichia canis]AAZ68575.1 Biotin/lipoyl attachment:Carbamoyl-phosphate synthase L chain, ATP-binding:Carbamoyl-phosphate synthetase large chain, N- terminal:Biotincarboxylase,C-terminal [Ehrlichia canis str. Jake]AUO54684.1 acetyl-CoA carboxylase biotin carboxylase subunit [Ehrlichia canis]UKC53040.1 acetyl-CoA carboxylase biotin carboxylase subunit [Ehrlichia canis]UKC53977.1 acetyl-CoA carboxylase biotin carboxylase subunit [Ehrlichia can
MIKKILIANRGEIACRVMRTASKMGISCVSVYSSADVYSLHVLSAEEAVNIGPAPVNQSYLNMEKICEVAHNAGVDAVHPGYGFLSENAEFPEKLQEYNIQFIGPSPSSIRMMADKITSKKIAESAQVNIIPGYMGIVDSVDEAKSIARSIGFPVMIKATAGGGGKGMRIVKSCEEMDQAFTSATNEAAKNFKDGRIFIEKYIELPRHIEIQIIADKYGNIVCLGERECSIQRHNQKVIEETPSPFLNEETRQKMYQQCVNLAKKVGYYSAGTIEFIVDQNRQFYFLEMNTRLQVEHPVTELVTGIDIVEEMIRIADGEKLRFTQQDVKFIGSAIESRIYAEDPVKNFLPSSGRIVYYSAPMPNDNLRIDSGVFEGAEVSMFYDPMIAKVCTYGKNRDEAVSFMQKYLNEFYIGGIAHNIDFLLSVFHHPVFMSGNINTRFVEQFYSGGFEYDPLTEDCIELFVLTSLCIFFQSEYDNSLNHSCNSMDLSVYVDGQEYFVNAKYQNGKVLAIYNQNEYLVSGTWNTNFKIFKLQISEELFHVKVDSRLNKYKLRYSTMSALCVVYRSCISNLLPIMPQVSTEELCCNNVCSPISGMIVKIYVKEGEKVQPGQSLLVIEAMKMENVIYSNVKSVVKSVFFSEGNSVIVGDVIIEFSE